MKSFKFICVLTFLTFNGFSINSLAQGPEAIIELNIKFSPSDETENTTSHDFAVGYGTNIGKNFKVAIKFGNEEYRTCTKSDFGTNCKTAFNLLTELEGGIFSEKISSFLIGRLTQSKTLAGAKLEIPIFDDHTSINLKALLGEDRKLDKSVSEYGAGITVRF